MWLTFITQNQTYWKTTGKRKCKLSFVTHKRMIDNVVLRGIFRLTSQQHHESDSAAAVAHEKCCWMDLSGSHPFFQHQEIS